MEVLKDENTQGYLEVKITPQVLEGQYLPGLEEIMQSEFSGKVAHAVRKNYQFARQTFSAFQRVRAALWAKHCQVDDLGNVRTSKNDEGQDVVMFKSEESEAEFAQDIRKTYQESLFTMRVHRVFESEITNMAKVRPAALMMLDPMFYTDPLLVDSVEIPLEFRELVTSHHTSKNEQAPITNAEQESDFREDTEDTQQAGVLRDEAIDLD